MTPYAPEVEAAAKRIFKECPPNRGAEGLCSCGCMEALGKIIRAQLASVMAVARKQGMDDSFALDIGRPPPPPEQASDDE